MAGSGHDNVIELDLQSGRPDRRPGRRPTASTTGPATATARTTSTVDGLNRLTGQANALGTINFSHDPRSNRVNDEFKTYVYDSENKARGTATAPWHYDPLGRLSGVSTSAGAPPAIAYESYVDNLIAERTPGSSSVRRRHVFGPGDRRAPGLVRGLRHRRPPLPPGRRARLDRRGQRRQRRRPERQQLRRIWPARSTATPIGCRASPSPASAISAASASTITRPGSTTPRLGRFMQPDPIGYEGGMNLYAYVGRSGQLHRSARAALEKGLRRRRRHRKMRSTMGGRRPKLWRSRSARRCPQRRPIERWRDRRRWRRR